MASDTIQDMLARIKVGSQLWIGDQWKERSHIEEVTRLTPTLIITKAQYSTRDVGFRKKDGWQNRRFASYHITAIATAEEVAEQVAAKERRIAQVRAEKEKSDRIEAKRLELNALFDGAAYVHENEGKWNLHIESLTETQVREFAGKFLPIPQA